MVQAFSSCPSKVSRICNYTVDDLALKYYCQSLNMMIVDKKISNLFDYNLSTTSDNYGNNDMG